VPVSPISKGPLRPTPWLFAASLAAFAAFFLWAQSRRPMGRFPRVATIAATALSLCLIFSGIGCGGGGAPSSTPPQAQQTVVARPSPQPPGGTFGGPQSVSIIDSASSSTIYYTTDGSTPTASSSVYSAPFSWNSPATVKAMATAAGSTNSSVASSAFTFRSPGGNYSITVNVSATPAGTAKSLLLTPILLTLVVN
jgi:hypothetical protein